MNEQDEKTLWVRFKERADAAARDELTLRHMRVVKYVAGRMAMHVPPNIEMDDLIGWGVLGLLDALEKYDHRQDIKFSTYATIRIRGAIIDQIRSLDWAPRSLRAMARKVSASRNKLRHRQGKEPTAEEIAADLGTTTEEVEETVAQLQTARVLSLDDYMSSDGGENRSHHAGADRGAASAVAHVEEEERRLQDVMRAILQLPDQQQKVLNLYYYEKLTLKEIGAVLDVTESRVCQIHTAAMKKLRELVRGSR